MKNLLVLVMICLLYSATVFGAESFDPSKVVSYKCGGTEPFWDMTISPKGIVLKDMGKDKTMSLPYVRPENARGIKDGFIRVYKVKDSVILVKYNENGCSDGMSDDLYRYDATVITNDGVLSGCCNQQRSQR